MSHRLIDLNDHLRRLRDEGFNVDIISAHLVVRDVPHVNDKREIHRGILVSALNLNGDIVNQPSDHTAKFAGEYPCTSDGQPIEGIRHSTGDLRISDSLTTGHSFSSKPPRGYYESEYEKIRTYVAIISGPATNIDPTVTAQTRQVLAPQDDNSPFQYLDTASARAEINMITQKLAVEKLAIVGLGGTGSYVLDFLAKTLAKELHIFDGDTFSSHNAYRAPGAASKDDLHKQPLKVEYFKEIYSRMHKGIVAHPADVDVTNIDQLRGMACVFLCIGAGAGKRFIVEKLEEFGVPFIDVGMGLYAKNETLGGILRVTTSTPENRDKARSRISFAGDDEANEYDKNIQVADLNALNALFAVIRWKKMRGFYFDHKHERLSTYTIGGNLLLSEDIHESN
jgi:ThiF family